MRLLEELEAAHQLLAQHSVQLPPDVAFPSPPAPFGTTAKILRASARGQAPDAEGGD